MKFRGLLVDLADDDASREDRKIIAVKHELRVRGVDPDAVGREAARQPAQAFEVDRDLSQPGLAGLVGGPVDRQPGWLAVADTADIRRCRPAACGGPPVGLQGATQRGIIGRFRGQRLHGSRRIAGVEGVVERGGDSDRLGRQILVIHAKFDRHRAAGQRVGIGEKRIR